MKIVFSNPSDEKRISDHDREVLAAVMTKSKVPQIVITRTAATPRDEARAIYANCISSGFASQFALYGPIGDEVVTVAQECVQQRHFGRDATIEAMTQKIVALGPEKVSKHCVSDWSKLHVLDISAKQIDLGLHSAFEAAIKEEERCNEVSRHFSPYTWNEDPAFHLEIPQPTVAATTNEKNA